MADDNVAIIDEITDRIMARLLAQQLLKEPKPKKKYTAWERKLAWEYMTKFYRNKPKWFRHEVGGLPQGKNDAIYAKVGENVPEINVAAPAAPYAVGTS